MKNQRVVITLSLIILMLALIAASAGLFWQEGGTPYEYTTLRGDTAFIEGSGIYAYDTVSGAAQERGNDTVTLLLGVPLLLIGIVLSSRGSMRGHLMLTGSLGFFLYTYASMSFLTAFNSLFLIYVAIFSLSLFAFILALSGLEPAVVVQHVSPGFPRRILIGYFLAIAAFLTLAWLSLVMSAIRSGLLPEGSEPYTTLVIQALDLGVIVPAAALTAWMLWQRHAWGYTLAAVVILKILTMGAALIAMIVAMRMAGVPLEPVTTLMFILISLSGIVLAGLTLRSIHPAETHIAAPLRKHAA